MGVVRDETGEPVSGIEVGWSRPFIDEIEHPTPARLLVVTDASGRYRLEGIPTRVECHIRSGGGLFLAAQTEARVFRCGTRENVDIALKAGAVVSGSVREHNGAPTSGAVVWDPRTDKSCVTDDDGRFRLTGLSRSRLCVTSGLIVVTRELTGVDATEDIVLPERGQVQIVVRDKISHSVISGAMVELEARHRCPGRCVTRVVTSADGRASFLIGRGLEYGVSASATGYDSPEEIFVGMGKDTVEVLLDPAER